MVKKGQVGVLTIVLIILIVLVAIAILWSVIFPLIKEKGESIQVGQFSIGLEIKEVIIFGNGVSVVSVNRKSGKEELDGLKFVFYDESGNSVTRDGESIDELETKSYSFSAIDEPGFNTITKVGVSPIINNDLGMVSESEPNSVLSIPSRVVSWWRLDNLNDFIRGNTCVALEGGVSDGVLNGKINCTASGLNLKDNMAISFWVKGNGNEDKIIISKERGYEISIDSKKIKFVSGDYSGTSEGQLIDDWNHVVISVAVSSDPLSKIYLNKNVKIFSVGSFDSGDENLIMNGELEEVMIFNSGLDSTQVTGIYNTQKK